MKTKLKLAAFALFSTIIVQPSTLHGQGSLTPPGAPAPTMKTLDQIEARTPLAPNPDGLVIRQSGSYYLTGNLTVTNGDGIAINADNVTLDLNGFTISSTAPVATTNSAILLSGIRAHISIFNGHIQSGVTSSFGVFGGSGFGYGIYRSVYASNCRVSSVSVSSVLYDGINIGGDVTVVQSCTVEVAGGYGISAVTVLDSSALSCGSTGIGAILAKNCYGTTDIAGSYGVYAEIVNDCYGYTASVNNSSRGMLANKSAVNCYGGALAGVGLQASVGENCWGESTYDVGLEADRASNCYGTSAGNRTGLYAWEAQNCEGVSHGSGHGLDAAWTASNCRGASVSGLGLYADTAINCWGVGGGSTYGLRAKCALNCYGWNAYNGTGLDADIAQTCYGSSDSGTGLRFEKLGSMCWGERTQPFVTANYVNGTGMAGPVNLP